jgi:hypothetical protein
VQNAITDFLAVVVGSDCKLDTERRRLDIRAAPLASGPGREPCNATII